MWPSTWASSVVSRLRPNAPKVAAHDEHRDECGQSESQQLARSRGGAGRLFRRFVYAFKIVPIFTGLRHTFRDGTPRRHRDFSLRSCEFLSGMPTRRALLITPFAFAGLMALSRHRERPLPDARASGSGRRVKLVVFPDNGERETVVVNKIEKTDAEWQRELSPEEFAVARKKGTERAFTGRYWNNHEAGTYRCVCCGTTLFRSDEKFDSGTGWPSFWAPAAAENVATEDGRQPVHAADGSALRQMRRAPGACVSRRPGADRTALLHQLGVAAVRAEEGANAHGLERDVRMRLRRDLGRDRPDRFARQGGDREHCQMPDDDVGHAEVRAVQLQHRSNP